MTTSISLPEPNVTSARLESSSPPPGALKVALRETGTPSADERCTQVLKEPMRAGREEKLKLSTRPTALRPVLVTWKSLAWVTLTTLAEGPPEVSTLRRPPEAVLVCISSFLGASAPL